MTDHFKNIYANKALLYERMVSREDYRGNLFSALNSIVNLSGSVVVEFGTGTGRIARQLSVMTHYVYAFDQAFPMLEEAKRSLEITGMQNWTLAVGENAHMPVASNSADVVIEGWSFGHAAGWYPETWQFEVDRMLAEMQRILKPAGTAILLETMGTGSRTPSPPSDGLAELYRYWEQVHGFQYQWIRTDYQFSSVDEADELTRFFFGDELADAIVDSKSEVLPECTGVWWKQFN